MQSAKDMAASAKAGMDKTKATLQEKGERLTAHDPLKKEMATEKKEARIHEAERRKLEEQRHNAALSHGVAPAGVGHPTGTDYVVDEMGGGLGHHEHGQHHIGGGGTY